MKASSRWLRELLGLGVSALSASDIAKALTGAGLEVEAVLPYGAASRSVFVAEVTNKRPHPTKSKLTLVTLRAGAATNGGELELVCGAANVPEPGRLVVFAPVGTHLPAVGFTLEPKAIAGVESLGMLCSEAELGLRQAGGHGGILVLPPNLASPGTTLADAIPTSFDEILEIGLTPNRPDGLGHLGLARELAALLVLPFEMARAPLKTDATLSVASAVRISIADEARCPTYGAHLVRGIKVGPSPLHIQYRLEALGVRAISNAVDVTNIIMLKFGHPIHGFDRAKVRGAAIDVRCAKEGEAFVTLDGVKRSLVADDLLICDAEGPVALAGVMGGQDSGVNDDTTDLLIECAYFAPRSVRRSARRHGMHTESSHRFERGVDHGDVARVLEDAAALSCELCGGVAAAAPLLVGPGVPAPQAIRLRPTRAHALLGVEIPPAEMESILVRLGCLKVAGNDASELSFIPPTHRPDLGIEEDLIEEIVRVFGVDRVPAVLPAVRPDLGRADPTGAEALTGRVIEAARNVGLSQALTFAFTSKRHLEALGLGANTLTLKNPLSDDRSEMRTSLLPGLFDAVSRARRYGVPDVRLFSVGARFLPRPGEALPYEARSFAAVLAGHRDAVLTKPEPCDIYDAKGLALEIIARATNHRATVLPTSPDARPSYSHPRAAGTIVVDDRTVGAIGQLHPVTEKTLELDGAVLFIEIDLDALTALGVRSPRFSPIPTLPASTRDIAITVEEKVPSGEVERAILEAAGELAESVVLFDLFRGSSIDKDKKSLAYRVVYRDPNARLAPEKARTLTDAEVDARQAAVEATLRERFGAALRA